MGKYRVALEERGGKEYFEARVDGGDELAVGEREQLVEGCVSAPNEGFERAWPSILLAAGFTKGSLSREHHRVPLFLADSSGWLSDSHSAEALLAIRGAGKKPVSAFPAS